MTDTKAPAGAPKKPAFDDHQFGVRVSADARRLIEDAAARAAMKPATWIRMAAVQRARQEVGA